MVRMLQKGRTNAVEYDDIQPVADEIVEKTLPYITSLQIRDMVQVQRKISGRPQDVLNMRLCDIDRSGEVWKYTPFTHKTKYCGKIRAIPIGPKAQKILQPYLERCKDDPKQFVFPRPKAKNYGQHYCNAHCRRYFVKAEEDEPEWGKKFLNLYKSLYKIEAEIKDETAEERYRRRQSDSPPILDKLFDLCRECSNEATILPKSRLGQVCAYALSNEAALRRYASDGRLAIDNNVSERTLQEFVIGRKNWLFFGSPEAARCSAIVMSVLSSARRHGLNEWEYLVDVLYRLSDLRALGSVSDLLPDRWKKSPTPPTEMATLMADRQKCGAGFTRTQQHRTISTKLHNL